MTVIRSSLAVLAAAALVFGPQLSFAQYQQQPAAKPAEARPAGPQANPAGVSVKPVDPHAGHNHGPQETPKPTVVLKPGEKPGIKFDEPIYDFGRIRAGGDVQHEYWFTNTGNGPLEILQVKPSCGCTVAGEFTKIVPPGETGKIPVKLATKSATGPMNKSIRVSTNAEGADATVTLQIKGEVWQAVEVTPRTVAFGRITPDDAANNPERKVTIQNNLEGEMKLGDVVSSNPSFSATLSPVEAGKKYEMKVTLVPPVKTGNMTGKLTMSTGVADMPTLEVSVYAFVVAPIEVSPARVTLTPGRTEPQTVHMYVRSNVNKPFQVSELKAPNDTIKLELTDVKDSMTYRLKVDVPANFRPSQSDMITFATDDANVPTVSIPIVEMGKALPVRPNTAAPVTVGPAAAPGTFQPPAASARPAVAPQATEPAKPAQDTQAAQSDAASKDKPAGR